MNLTGIDLTNCMTAKELALAILALPEEEQCLPFTYEDDCRHPVTSKGTPLKVVSVDKDTYEEDDASKAIARLLCIG